MPKRSDINKVLIIGSGPIVIGQACEFDYSGTQACKALRSLGYEIVLVNSNPATIMTDPETADVTYIEPLNVARLTEIIEAERPDALLPNLGGQSALNLASELEKCGVLEKYGVRVLGVQIDAIERGEDRIEFKKTMESLGIGMARSIACYSPEEVRAAAQELNYPVVLRPAYTMGGTGGGIAYNMEELEVIAKRGLQASMIGQVLVEESILGWEELELEVVRDADNNMITVCFIENVDPLGVHTGDSVCTAPMLTVSEDVQKELQRQAYAIVEEVGVIGGTNVQFARNPDDGRIVVIEINPRTSRSSALASKATGFPIAYVSALLAAGLTLPEIPSGKFGTLDRYVPGGDYLVVKFPRWAFEKFKDASDVLGTQMKAVGEVMSIGKTFKEAFQKAVRSLEIGRNGLGFAKDFASLSREELRKRLAMPSSERYFLLYEALRQGLSVDELHALTAIKKYYLEQFKELVEEERELLSHAGNLPPTELLRRAKKNGFSDAYLESLLKIPEGEIRDARIRQEIVQVWQRIDVVITESDAYYYSTYNGDEDATVSDNRKKVMILGGGPNRIGQGIEFDYCCVHAAYALREMGIETIMVNCNPETVSTDYDTTDRLYFEPLTVEDVLGIYHKEKPYGVITQFGGQTPLNLANRLEAEGVHVLGTSPKTIDLAEDRDHFREMMDKLDIPMPESDMAVTTEEALAAAEKIGYPVMARPSYVLGGQGMRIVHDEDELIATMQDTAGITKDRPILIDRFLYHALECEADAISDGETAFVPAVMEQVELAGVHSGDSACILPALHLREEHLETIRSYTKKIAEEMHVVGLMNIQYAIENDVVYVIEANPRASRTVPLVSKVCDVNMVRLATRVMLRELTEEPSPLLRLKPRVLHHTGVKEAVFPFNMFPEVDPLLGPEMRSTGEVLGLADNFGDAFFKAQEAAKIPPATEGTVLLSVNDEDKPEASEIARSFAEMGFDILATDATFTMLQREGIPATRINKLSEGRPNISDAMTNGKIHMVINSPSGKQSREDDSYIRKQAVRMNIPYFTTMAAAKSVVEGIRQERDPHPCGVKSLQQFHLEIE